MGRDLRSPEFANLHGPDGDAGLGRWIPAKGGMTGAGVAEILQFECDCSVRPLKLRLKY